MGTSTGGGFDDYQTSACLSEARPRQAVSMGTDASAFRVGSERAGNNICIDIIEKVNDSSPTAVSDVFPEVASQVKPAAAPSWLRRRASHRRPWTKTIRGYAIKFGQISVTKDTGTPVGACPAGNSAWDLTPFL